MKQTCIESLMIALLITGCSKINKGVVVNKEHKKAWIQTVMINSGNVTIPRIIHHKEKWILNITDSGINGYCNVNKIKFDSVTIGDWVEC